MLKVNKGLGNVGPPSITQRDKELCSHQDRVISNMQYKDRKIIKESMKVKLLPQSSFLIGLGTRIFHIYQDYVPDRDKTHCLSNIHTLAAAVHSRF